MMTAMLCVENILADTKLYDLWQVNSDAEYHEAGPAAEEATAPGCACSDARRRRPRARTGSVIGRASRTGDCRPRDRECSLMPRSLRDQVETSPAADLIIRANAA